MYTKTLIRFDPQTKHIEVKSEIDDPRMVINVLLTAVATIVNQPAEQKLVVTPPGIVVL